MLSNFQGAHYYTDAPPAGFYCIDPGGKVLAQTWNGGKKIGATVNMSGDNLVGKCPINGAGNGTSQNYGYGGDWLSENETAVSIDGGMTFSIPGYGSWALSIE